MQVAVIWNPNTECRVHAVGCADIAKDARRMGEKPWITEFASKRAIVEDLFNDFIFANEMSPWTDYENEVTVLPCAALPREES